MTETIAYGSSARTVTPAAFTLDIHRVRNLLVFIDVTAIGVAPSVVPTIDGIDAATGKAFPILTGIALTAIGTRVLKVGPGITVAANLSVADIVPERIRITMTHGNADSITYAVTAHLIT